MRHAISHHCGICTAAVQRRERVARAGVEPKSRKFSAPMLRRLSFGRKSGLKPSDKRDESAGEGSPTAKGLLRRLSWSSKRRPPPPPPLPPWAFGGVNLAGAGSGVAVAPHEVSTDADGVEVNLEQEGKVSQQVLGAGDGELPSERASRVSSRRSSLWDLAASSMQAVASRVSRRDSTQVPSGRSRRSSMFQQFSARMSRRNSRDSAPMITRPDQSGSMLEKWTEVFDDQRRRYFWNEATNETRWE
eukprot:3084035-Prymnesium_polylepis.1